jgi:methionyl-tRNA formyltransferase
MPKNAKIIFMGTSSFAGVILESLIKDGYDIISVYTRPEKAIGRQQEIEKSVVKEMAEKNQLKIFQPEKLDEKATEEIKSQKPDLIIVAAYGKILPKSILNLPPLGAINVHASLLPKYRGPSPIQNAILNGEAETGTTIMLMDEGIDTGDILAQEKIILDKDVIYPEFLKIIAEKSAELLLKTISLWVDKKIQPQKQDEKEATYCQMIEREDGKVIWNSSVLSIYNQWRALTPWPGIFTFWEKNGANLRLKLHKISHRTGNFMKELCGEVVKFGDKIAVIVGDGIIILEEIQLEGKSLSKIEDFVNGYPEFIGSILK